MANVEGKATAITVLTPVRRGGPLLLWLVFWAGRNITETLKKLETLSFIHYARWATIERFPDQGEGEQLHHTYLLFESNFNGTWDQYIDAFSEVVPLRMKAIWGTSFGFPGPLPVVASGDGQGRRVLLRARDQRAALHRRGGRRQGGVIS